jgi:hypothetical protein
MLPMLKNKKISELGIAFLLAASLTILLNVPLLARFVETGRVDAPLLISMANEDEARYISRIKEFSDGQPLMGNPFYKEHRNDLPPGGFAEWIIAIPMKLFGLSLGHALAITDVLFPFLIITLTYLWCVGALKNRLLAVAAVFLIIGELKLGLLRDSHPKITLLPASLYLFAVFARERKTAWLLARGILLGIMFHTYPYHWTFFAVFEGLDALAELRSLRSWRAFGKNLLLVFGPFALSAVPWTLLVRMNVDPILLRRTYEHLNLVHTRLPVAPALQAELAAWIIAFFVLRKTKLSERRASRTILLLLLAGLIMLNSNLLTGSEVEFLGHFWRVFWPIVAVAALSVAGIFLAQRWQRTIVIMISVLAVVGIAESAMNGVTLTKETEARFSKYDAVIAFLNEKAPGGSVVLAPRDLNQILPVRTDDYVFQGYGAQLFFVPEAELADRFLAFAALFPEDVGTGGSEYIGVFGNGYGSAYSKAKTVHAIQKALGLTEEPFTKTQGDFITDQEIRRRIDMSLAHTNWANVKEALDRYEVEYLVMEKTLPRELSDMFTHEVTLGQMTVYSKNH